MPRRDYPVWNRDYFIFGGKSSREFGITIEKIPVMRAPARRRNTISVPGRNGDLHIDDDTFENFQQSYEIWFQAMCDHATVTDRIKNIKKWLYADGQYHHLEDSYNYNVFHLATFAGPLDLETQMLKYGRCVITFDCAPQCFMREGLWDKTFKEAGTIGNSGYTAKPLIKIYGNGPGTLTIGNVTVTIHELIDQLTLDCETENAYRQVGDGVPENKNRAIYAPVFPTLPNGISAVSWTGGITRVDIKPRWWFV